MSATLPFTSKSRATLQSYQWWPSQEQPTAHIFFMHGLFDHVGRYAHMCEQFAAHGFAVHACDMIGHGQSSGDRGLIADYEVVVADLHHFVCTTLSLLAAQEDTQPRFVVIAKAAGCILASHVVAQLLSDPTLLRHPRAFLCISPAGKVDETYSSTRKTLAKLAARVAPRMDVGSIKVEFMNRDLVERERYLRDPLVHHGGIQSVTAATMLAAIDAQDYTRITCPLFVLAAEHEHVVDADAAAAMYEAVPAAIKVLKAYANAWHDLLHEPEAEICERDMLEWCANVVALRDDAISTIAAVDRACADGTISARVCDEMLANCSMLQAMRSRPRTNAFSRVRQQQGKSRSWGLAEHVNKQEATASTTTRRRRNSLDGNAPTMFQCSQCDRHYELPSDLNVHIRKRHTAKKTEPSKYGSLADAARRNAVQAPVDGYVDIDVGASTSSTSPRPMSPSQQYHDLTLHHYVEMEMKSDDELQQ